MASNDNVFDRLKRLFSSNVVVRSIGGRKLKVVDTNKLQMYSTGGRRDRFNRIHRAKPYHARHGTYDRGFAYQAVRLELFRDYDAMDSDPIIASAVDIYADESTTKNEYGEIITIESEDDQIKSVLENLFYDVLNIEFNLWPWIRSMCKYGDFFLFLDIHETYGIHNVIPLSVYDVERIEGVDEDNPYEVKFKLTDTSILGRGEFDNYEVAHFRLLSDSNFIPYGRAMIENARRVWKQLKLMEDAMMIHRIMRAPEKRVFRIDIGNIKPSEVDAYMNKIMDKMKKTPFIDPKTGEYNMKFNLQNITEDFYLPVRGGDSGTDISTTPGLQYDAVEDIEYLQNKLMAALKIPKAFLGYESEVRGKATLAAEDVRFARTIERIQRIVVSELTKIAIVHLYVQGFKDENLVNFSLELTNPSTIYEQEKINLWSEKTRLAEELARTNLLSSDWIYENVFGLSEDEWRSERRRVLEDVKRRYRYEQIEREGNDPKESKKHSAGHGDPQESLLYGDPDKGKGGSEDEIDYEDEAFKQGGRPKESGNRDSDDRAFGRDPFGDKENRKPVAGTADRKRGNPFAFERIEKFIDDLATQLDDRFDNIGRNGKKMLIESEEEEEDVLSEVLIEDLGLDGEIDDSDDE